MYSMKDLSDEKDAEALTKVNEYIANPDVEDKQQRPMHLQ